MSITILYFARLRETLGTERESLEFAAPLTISDLKQQLGARGDRWQQAFADQRLLNAINQATCKDDQLIEDGDEIAFFPPVTGG